MSFVWPLGLAFAALIPLVVALYFLKLRRVPKIVSSTYLWKRAVDEFRVNRPFQRFQNKLLLWLQLLLLALLILALARPFFHSELQHSGVHLYLLDHSASMNAREEDGTRLSQAKEFLREAIRGKEDGDLMMIVAFSDRARVAAPLTAEKEPLLRALDGIRPTHRPTKLADAWRAVLSVARQFDRSDVYIVSDGGFGSLEQLTQANATVHYVPVGKGTDNLGIVRLESRESEDDRETREIFASVLNRRVGAAKARVELTVNGRLVDAKDVDVPAGEKKGVVFRRRMIEEGVAEVRLAGGDALADDDRAWTPLHSTDPARVLLVGEENLFLREALGNDPQVELSVLASDDYRKLDGNLPSHDLFVFDRVAPKSLPRGTVLCLGTAPEMEGFEAGPTEERPTLINWDADHPLTRYVNFSTFRVSKLMTGSHPGWLRTLLSSDRGPVIAAGERAGVRLAIIRFGLLESDWPLRASFPIFISNLVRWARDVDVLSSERVVRPGQPLPVRVPPDVREGTLVLPDGEERPLEPGDGRRIVISDTERPGIYRVRWKGRSRDALYAVNLLDPAESDIRVPEEVTLGEKPLIGMNQGALVRREFTPFLLLAALAILFLEWFLYQFQRGKV